MADLFKNDESGMALLMVGAGIGLVFLSFRFYCRWKFNRMVR